MNRRRALALATLTLVLEASCDFTSFDTFRSHAPIVTFLPPDGFPSARFGGFVAVATDTVNDTDWLVSSAGLGTAVIAQPLRVRDVVSPARPLAQMLCSAPTDCGSTMSRFGIALGAIDGWRDGEGCAMTGSFGSIHSVSMRCLGNTPARVFTLPAPAGFEQSGYGLALAAPRRHRATDPPARDLLFVGATAGPGHVFAVTPTAVTEITPTVMGATAMGSALAVGRFRASDGVSELLLAAASTSGVVAVMHGDPRAGRAMQRLGCFSRSEPGFGLAITMGDLDGDGTDEIVVGDGDEAGGRVDVVHVYATAQANGSGACDTGWPEVLAVQCYDVTDRGVRCAGLPSHFGSAIAAGDIDGDGRDELLIGAPHATVDGVARAGAVFVMHASASGAALTLTMSAVMRDAAPTVDALLGRDVRVALIARREEPIVAVPGSTAVRAYFCSGIDGDRPNSAGLTLECR